MISSRLAEKRQELHNLQQVQLVSKDLVSELEALSAHMHSLADGTEVVATLMANWSSILNAMQLASASLAKYTENDYEEADTKPVDEKPLPETLVRVPIDGAENA